MNIAIVTHKVDKLDGQGRVNYEIVTEAFRQGHHVTVFAEFCSEDIANHPLGRFIRSRRRHIPTQFLRNLHFAHVSAVWLRKNRSQFDVIQANGFVTWEPVDIVAVHFVHTAWLRSHWFPFGWSLKPYSIYQRLLAITNSFFEKRTFRNAKLLIAVSEFTAGEVAKLGITSAKIAVVHNGVDTNEFKPGENRRSDFHLPHGVPLALFVGDIKTPRKNLETVLKSMLALPNLHLVVAGAKEGSPYIGLARGLGVENRVHFIGKTKGIPALMQSVDLFVFPSRYEAHPLVLLEAMASGLPSVVSGNFGAANYMGEGAIIFDDPNNSEELALSIGTVVNSPERSSRMAAAARQTALKMQWLSTAQKYLRLYEAFLRESKTSTQAGKK